MLSQREIVSKVSGIAKPIAESFGLELFDVKYSSKGGRWILTIVIDKENDYVSTQDCEKVSMAVEKELDRLDFIPGRYYLEVASPGLDRPLRNKKDFERFKGNFAKVKADQTYKGYIKDVLEEEIVLDVDGTDVRIQLSNIKNANLEIDF